MALREIPTYRPSMAEFKDFAGYIAKIEADGAHHYGLAKIIPPKSWGHRTPLPYTRALKDSPIASPIEQAVVGTRGAYMLMNIEKKMRTVDEYRKLAEQDDQVAPKHTDYDDLERLFWRERPYGKVVYGADIPGTHFDDSTNEFNLGKLPDILHDMGNTEDFHLLGVNTPYLYYGMWKATFCWHVEDMNLYSINYVHAGAPKTWYSIPPEFGDRFEALVQSICPANFRTCSQFLRHKMTLVSPNIVKNSGIPIYKVTQEPGEFIITFPFAYHQGFNHGFNIAEATNFASERWIEYGVRCKRCFCHGDNVRIDMAPFVKRYRPELWAEYKKKNHIESDDDSEVESAAESEESSDAPRRGRAARTPRMTAAQKAAFRREKDSNRNATRADSGRESQLTCAVCFEEGPLAPGTVLRHGMPDAAASPKTPAGRRKAGTPADSEEVEPESSEDEDTSSEQEYECEGGCGFESTIKSQVVKHERTCPRLASINGNGSKNVKKQHLAAQREVMTCVGCSVAVHRCCYDIGSEVSGYGWRCERCIDGPRMVKCALCPHAGGPLQQTADGSWVHTQCALALPELGVGCAADVGDAQLSDVDASRSKMQCVGCKKRKKAREKAKAAPDLAGACVQCSDSKCATAFHVTCAQRDPLLFASMQSGGKEAEWDFYCFKHRPSAPKAELLPGDRVWTKCRSKCYYEGTVRSVQSQVLHEVMLQDGTVLNQVLQEDLRRVSSLKPKARQALVTGKSSKLPKGFDMVLQQRDGAYLLCSSVSEETKVSYEVELHNGMVRSVNRSSILTAEQVKEKQKANKVQAKGKTSPLHLAITFVSKEQQKKEASEPRKKRALLDTMEDAPDSKRKRVRHNYAALASGGHHSQARLAMFWAGGRERGS